MNSALSATPSLAALRLDSSTSSGSTPETPSSSSAVKPLPLHKVPDSPLQISSDFVNAWGSARPFADPVLASLDALDGNSPFWQRIGRLVGDINDLAGRLVNTLEQERALEILQFKLDVLWSISDAIEKAYP